MLLWNIYLQYIILSMLHKSNIGIYAHLAIGIRFRNISWVYGLNSQNQSLIFQIVDLILHVLWKTYDKWSFPLGCSKMYSNHEILLNIKHISEKWVEISKIILCCSTSILVLVWVLDVQLPIQIPVCSLGKQSRERPRGRFTSTSFPDTWTGSQILSREVGTNWYPYGIPEL